MTGSDCGWGRMPTPPPTPPSRTGRRLGILTLISGLVTLGGVKLFGATPLPWDTTLACALFIALGAYAVRGMIEALEEVE